MFDDIHPGDGYKQSSQGSDKQKQVWCPVLPVQKPISAFQDRQMSLEMASQVGNSDFLRGLNVAETIFPTLGGQHNMLLRWANARMTRVSSCYFHTVVVS
jgi:hypothetical protein